MISSFLASNSSTSQVELTYCPLSQTLCLLVSHTTVPAQSSVVSITAILGVSNYQSRNCSWKTCQPAHLELDSSWLQGYASRMQRQVVGPFPLILRHHELRESDENEFGSLVGWRSRHGEVRRNWSRVDDIHSHIPTALAMATACSSPVIRQWYLRNIYRLWHVRWSSWCSALPHLLLTRFASRGWCTQHHSLQIEMRWIGRCYAQSRWLVLPSRAKRDRNWWDRWPGRFIVDGLNEVLSGMGRVLHDAIRQVWEINELQDWKKD